MNSIHLPAYQQRPIQLAGDAAFGNVASVSKNFDAVTAEGVAGALAARHCAGCAYRPDGAAALGYLRGKTKGTPQMEAAIRSLLNRCSGTDALHLATLCRVPVRRLAHCVRTLDVTNFTLIRFLNQFAQRTPSGVVPVDGENPTDLQERSKPTPCQA